MIGLAFLSWLCVMICYGGNYIVGQGMVERPLVVGLVAGLLMGDVTTGIIMGAALEAIFMGVVNIGGSFSAEPVTATTLAVAFTVGTGMEQSAAIALAVPVGVVTAFVALLIKNVIWALFTEPFMRLARAGNATGLAIEHYVLWFFRYGSFALVAFFAVLFGAEPVAAIVDQVPANLMAGFNAVADLLPAVGMALLLQMLWSKELCCYFFLGFILFEYFSTPMIAVAAIGVIIAIVTAMRDRQILDINKKGQAVAAPGLYDADEEDFFA